MKIVRRLLNTVLSARIHFICGLFKDDFFNADINCVKMFHGGAYNWP